MALRWLAPAPSPELMTESPVQAATFCLRLLEEAQVKDLDRARRYLTTLSA